RAHFQVLSDQYAPHRALPSFPTRRSSDLIGMSTEQVGRLFQAFTQAEASTTRKYGGTGLGLAISKKFCEVMGGDLSATTQLGKRSEEHTSELQSLRHLVCRLLLEKKKCRV